MSKKSIIIGTAGHIDHGKTTLVKALTGVNTDRLEEEQKRGITIELGFAPLDLEDIHIGFVDVPGHEKFVKNMLAGAGGIDAMLLIVAADESVMPQTKEHVEICHLLGIKNALVAVTKADLADPEMVELVSMEISELLEENGFNNIEIAPVSSTTGQGITELREKLKQLCLGLEAKSESGLPRLPVDRVFTMKGFGTVITGTLISGVLKVGDNVELLPSGKTTSVKNIQVHGSAVEQAVAGHRVAVNLPGIAVEDIERGETLTLANSLEASAVMDLHCSVLPSSECMLEHNQRIRFHLGAAELLGRIAIFGSKEIHQGADGFFRIRLEKPACGVVGDHFVIRRYSPMVTIGGGVVLDNQPLGRRESKEEIIDRLTELKNAGLSDRITTSISRRNGSTSPENLVKEFGVSKAEAIEYLNNLDPEIAAKISENPLKVCGMGFIKKVRSAIQANLLDLHAANPLVESFNTESLKTNLPFGTDDALFRYTMSWMQELKWLITEGSMTRCALHEIQLDGAQETAYNQIINTFLEAGTAPPSPADVNKETGHKDAQALFELALGRKIIIRIAKDIFYHQQVLEGLIKDIRIKAGDAEFTVPDFKDWFGISRKYAIPVLEYLDLKGITYRQGDARKLSKI